MGGAFRCQGHVWASFFPLQLPDEVDGFSSNSRGRSSQSGTSDKTVDVAGGAECARARLDVAIGFIRLPGSRRERSRRATGVAPARSSSCLERHALFHLDEFAIAPDQLVPLLKEHLPPEVGPPVRNEAVVTLEPYRALLSQFLQGQLPEERFQWGYLDRLAKEALWRDDETFALLNSLFDNEWGRDVKAARLVAVEFQGQLAGRLEPLKARAARMLDRLADR